MAITGFKNKGLKKLWEKGDARHVGTQYAAKLSRQMTLLNKAVTLDDLKPFYRFHELTGNLKEFYSWDVSGNYRLIYRFTNGDAYDLDFLDTH